MTRFVTRDSRLAELGAVVARAIVNGPTLDANVFRVPPKSPAPESIRVGPLPIGDAATCEQNDAIDVLPNRSVVKGCEQWYPRRASDLWTGDPEWRHTFDPRPAGVPFGD